MPRFRFSLQSLVGFLVASAVVTGAFRQDSFIAFLISLAILPGVLGLVWRIQSAKHADRSFAFVAVITILMSATVVGSSAGYEYFAVGNGSNFLLLRLLIASAYGIGLGILLLPFSLMLFAVMSALSDYIGVRIGWTDLR